MRKVNGLGHGIVRVSLERRLHANMPFRGDVERSHEQPLQVLRHPGHALEGFSCRDPHEELLGIEATYFGGLDQVGIQFGQGDIPERVAGERQRKERFDAA